MRRQVLAALVALALPAAAVSAGGVPDRVDGTAWSVRITPTRAAAGKPARVEVTVEARGGYHLNDEYPINLTAAPTAGVRFDKPRVVKADGITSVACAKDPTHGCKATVPLAFVSDVQGTLKVGGTLAFSACDDHQCLIEKIAVAAPVVVD